MTFEFSGALYRLVDYAEQVEIDGRNLRECLTKLTERYPRLGEALLDQQGRLGMGHQLFINGDQVEVTDLNGYDRIALAEDDVVFVLTALTGG